MKTLRIIPLLIFLILNQSSLSQITLIRPDFPVVGDFTRSILCANTGSVNEGLPGSNMIWDYSTLDSNGGALPKTFYYTNATSNCNNEDLRSTFSPGTGGENYAYMTNPYIYDKTIDNSWYFSAYDYTRCYVNNWKTMKFPFTYNDSLISFFDFNSSYWNGMTAIYNSFGNGYDSTFCDGWGTLIIPTGTFNVLRTVSYIYEQDTNFITGIPYHNSMHRIYRWYTNAHCCPLLTVNYTSNFNHSTNTWGPFQKSVYLCASINNSVALNDPSSPNSKLIITRLMNSDTYEIHFSNFVNGEYEIMFLDVQGKLVLQVKADILTENEKLTVDFQSLSAGFYTVRCITKNTNSTTQKFVKL